MRKVIAVAAAVTTATAPALVMSNQAGAAAGANVRVSGDQGSVYQSADQLGGTGS